MTKPITDAERLQLQETVQMFEVIVETQPNDLQSLEILKEAYWGLHEDEKAVGISKKIAQVYMRLGQVSSAILEYEGILQKFPSDQESQAALGELEGKMTELAAHGVSVAGGAAAQPSEDIKQFINGSEALVAFFREHQLLSERDAGSVLTDILSAIEQTPSDQPTPSVLAFISDRGIASMEKSLALLAEKTRLPYLPLSLYDVDSNKASLLERQFCLRHLVLPFDQVSKALFVATVNPFDAQARNQVESGAKTRIQWYLTQPQDLTRELKRIFRIT